MPFYMPCPVCPSRCPSLYVPSRCPSLYVALGPLPCVSLYVPSHVCPSTCPALYLPLRALPCMQTDAMLSLVQCVMLYCCETPVILCKHIGLLALLLLAVHLDSIWVGLLCLIWIVQWIRRYDCYSVCMCYAANTHTPESPSFVPRVPLKTEPF